MIGKSKWEMRTGRLTLLAMDYCIAWDWPKENVQMTFDIVLMSLVVSQ